MVFVELQAKYDSEDMTSMSKYISRRDFLKGAAIGAAGIGMLGTGILSAAAETPPTTWDGAYDVVVMGFGAAGASAAFYAAKAGAKVLVFDVAPNGHDGGNSRYCMQCIVVGNREDKEKLMAYYKALYGELPYDEEVIDVFTDGICELEQRFLEDFGCDTVMRLKQLNSPSLNWALPEFPEHEGSEAIDACLVHLGFFDAACYKLLRSKVYEYGDKIDLWHNARGIKLIQDPETGTVTGVTIEKDGEAVNIRAYNGIVMACGGFENNPQMIGDYFSIERSNPMGTLYNRGDGHRMAMEINADFWHMHCFESGSINLGVDVGAGKRSSAISLGNGGYFVVNEAGKRYCNEAESLSRHGHVEHGGEFHLVDHNKTAYYILDQTMYDTLTYSIYTRDAMLKAMVSADSLEELAEKIHVDAKNLLHTAELFNRFIEEGEDIVAGRDISTMAPLAQAPYYAFPACFVILNTQGGPRRNARAEILDVYGSPIPHLYSAGEFGGMTAKDYQGATNISECLVFGRIAGTNAAEDKGDYEPITAPLTYTIGSGSSSIGVEHSFELVENEYVGVGDGMGGDLIVKVKVEDGVIAAIEPLLCNETEDIGTKEIEMLIPAMLEAQSAKVDRIAGATVTYAAFVSAVSNALAEAGIE